MIRGAAGSGKTTTALLRLKFLANFRHNRAQRARSQGDEDAPVNILVLTFNKTLRGYVNALAREQLPAELTANLEVSTFAKWGYDLLSGSGEEGVDARNN